LQRRGYGGNDPQHAFMDARPSKPRTAAISSAGKSGLERNKGQAIGRGRMVSHQRITLQSPARITCPETTLSDSGVSSRHPALSPTLASLQPRDGRATLTNGPGGVSCGESRPCREPAGSMSPLNEPGLVGEASGWSLSTVGQDGSGQRPVGEHGEQIGHSQNVLRASVLFPLPGSMFHFGRRWTR